MFNPPTAQDEWVMLFVAEMMSLGLPDTQMFIAMLARELWPELGHLPPTEAAAIAFCDLTKPPDVLH